MVYNITQKEKVIVPRHSKNLGPGYNHAAHYTQNKARAHYCCSSTMVWEFFTSSVHRENCVSRL